MKATKLPTQIELNSAMRWVQDGLNCHDTKHILHKHLENNKLWFTVTKHTEEEVIEVCLIKSYKDLCNFDPIDLIVS